MTVSDYLISQYYDKPKIRGIIESMESILDVEISDQIPYLKQCMGSRAEGIWLELLAKRFKMERPLVSDPNAAIFFGLVTDGINTTNKASFNQAPFVPDGQGASAGRIFASDETFSKLVSMAASNLRTDGSQDNVNQVLDGLFKGSFAVDNQDMTMDVLIHSTASDNDTSIILDNQHLIPKPVGVKMTVSTFKYFGYDGNEAGFDQSTYK